MSNYQYEIASLILRVFLGTVFLFQGYDKLFTMGIGKVVNTFEHPLIVKHFPAWLLWFSAAYTSVVEFVGGIFLVVGILKYYTLYLLGIDLLMVTVAFSFISPMWNMEHVFFRLALLILLLVIPASWDTISLDALLLKF